MKNIIVFILLINSGFSSSSHNVQKADRESKYFDYILTTPSEKKAKAVYKCTCENRDWKQDAAKTKACPYCGPAMSQCGYLVRVLPARNTKYEEDSYVLPNKICPVSSKKIKNKEHFVKINKMKVFLCCKTCVKKFNKAIKKEKVSRYMRKLELKPELFGFNKTSANNSPLK